MTRALQPRHIQRVALVAAPWTLFNRPSIQIAALKAYLHQQLADIHIDAWHVFLNIAENIGYKTYAALSQRTWLAETVYAALLYPERARKIEKLYGQYASRAPELRNQAFGTLVQKVKKATDAIVRQKDWARVDLVGVSVSLCQMTASLYIISAVKKLNPAIRVVVGGTTFCGPSARKFLDAFVDIDFIIQGEGEVPLARLIDFLNSGTRGSDESHAIQGVVSRNMQPARVAGFSQIPDIETLPCPDFEDYFRTLRSFPPENRFFATLPVEASRGCWWNRSGSLRGISEKQASVEKIVKDGCAFCNLNLQWQGYRTKSPRQVAREIDGLTTKHQTLSVAFVDNVLPSSRAASPFPEIVRLNKDIKLFGEVRANMSVSSLKAMRRAGLREVQVGIESLSAGLLQKMNKGTRVIQNLEIMKHCEMLGLKNSSNLMLGFPGSDENDVNETLAALDFALPFQPLKPVRFWLGLESPVWKNYREFNIASIRNHPGYGVLFPKSITDHLTFIIQAYRGDIIRQRKAWKPVENKINRWRKVYAKMHAQAFSAPILSYQDGGTFLIIRQRHHRAAGETHRLTGLSREIYLFCQTHQPVKKILNAFPNLTRETLLPFLRMMNDKRLMFKENDRYLSLAIPEII